MAGRCARGCKLPRHGHALSEHVAETVADSGRNGRGDVGSPALRAVSWPDVPDQRASHTGMPAVRAA